MEGPILKLDLDRPPREPGEVTLPPGPIDVRLVRVEMPFWHAVRVLTYLIIAATPALLFAAAFWGAIYVALLAVLRVIAERGGV